MFYHVRKCIVAVCRSTVPCVSSNITCAARSTRVGHTTRRAHTHRVCIKDTYTNTPPHASSTHTHTHCRHGTHLCSMISIHTPITPSASTPPSACIHSRRQHKHTCREQSEHHHPTAVLCAGDDFVVARRRERVCACTSQVMPLSKCGLRPPCCQLGPVSLPSLPPLTTPASNAFAANLNCSA